MTTSTRTTSIDRSVLVADVARAGAFVAPYWPLTSFVAVNPLGGLQDKPFDEATSLAGRWFGARTHLALDAYRAEYARGAISDADLDRSIRRRLPWVAEAPPVEIGRVRFDVIDLIRWDLLHGPADESAEGAPTLADALDDIVTAWCSTYVDDAHVPWAMPDRSLGFYRSWRALASADRRLAGLIGRQGREQLGSLPEDPVEMLELALSSRGVGDEERVAAIRTLLLRTPGWAGFALVRRLGTRRSRGGPPPHGRPRSRTGGSRSRRSGASRTSPDRTVHRNGHRAGPGGDVRVRPLRAVRCRRRDDRNGARQGLGGRSGSDLARRPRIELPRSAPRSARRAEWTADAVAATRRPADLLHRCPIGGIPAAPGVARPVRDVRVRRVLRCARPLATARIVGGPGPLSGAGVASTRDRRGRRRRRSFLSRLVFGERRSPRCVLRRQGRHRLAVRTRGVGRLVRRTSGCGSHVAAGARSRRPPRRRRRGGSGSPQCHEPGRSSPPRSASRSVPA